MKKFFKGVWKCIVWPFKGLWWLTKKVAKGIWWIVKFICYFILSVFRSAFGWLVGLLIIVAIIAGLVIYCV